MLLILGTCDDYLEGVRNMQYQIWLQWAVKLKEAQDLPNLIFKNLSVEEQCGDNTNVAIIQIWR